MAGFKLSSGSFFLVILAIICLLPGAHAFGAGNIPGISTVEGHNWRHGDIEDMLKTVACLKGHKWTSMMIKRVYFGNWLRDYSQAVDVGSLKGVSAPTIRILVWVLSFLSFGYATREFEVTDEKLGVYRPEEHIDNPKDYADNLDARQFDPRLRGPVDQAELQVDPNTGMKNYIANERGGWATSAGYIKYSLSKSIHHGRLYTHGSGSSKGKEEDLCEALRCMGQALHCLEDWGAHTNYVELALIEMGFRDVFPHVGAHTQLDVRGKMLYPLTTGTFGAVDFLHSVLGEADDHLSQSEIDEMDIALLNAETSSKGSSTGTRGFFGSGSSSGGSSDFLSLLSQIPGQGSGLASQARDLQSASDAQEYENQRTRAGGQTQFQGPPGSVGGPPGPGIPGMKPDFDPIKTAKQIYPILEFRDNVVRAISATIAKIPGLEKLVETISEKITVFIMSLLAPFVRPIIEAVSKSLKDGSSTVVKSSADQQFVIWNDPTSSDPTHSMLSKDHFSNYLNPIAGRVAATILQYTVPRVLFAWENPGVPVSEVVEDILRAFHHPALRDNNCEIQRNMFSTVKKWVDENPKRDQLNHILSSQSVKAGRNHGGGNIHDEKTHSHSHGGGGHDSHSAFGGYGQAASQVWGKIQNRDLSSMYEGQGASRGVSPEPSNYPQQSYGYSNQGHSTGGQFFNTSHHDSGGYDGATPTHADPYGGGYQAQANPYSQPSMPGGWDNQPQQHGGWSQGPPAPSPYERQDPYGAPPQQGGWSQGPPQQQGGWSQRPTQQGGWSGGESQPGWSEGDQQQGGWSHGGHGGHGGHGLHQGGGYGGY